MRSRTPSIRMAVLLAGLLAVLLLPTAPAGAGVDWSKVRYHPTSGGCRSDGTYYDVGGRVYLTEYGKSGVVRFEAKYRLYRTEVSAGWNYPRLEKTYSSLTFPNDHRTFGQALPSNGFHTWTQIFATTGYRLDAKMRWERRWRRDWTYQAPIVYCR